MTVKMTEKKAKKQKGEIPVWALIVIVVAAVAGIVAFAVMNPFVSKANAGSTKLEQSMNTFTDGILN